MARLRRGGFLFLAVVFHLLYILSIFDVYFTSPIVHGMRAHRVEHHDVPAKRLVLFVGDGLRADKAFQSFPDPSPKDLVNPDLTPRPLAPFLRSRVLEYGTFGVSHTRVPTESRPGHVALIAGLYEDVSAVATGWKLNPVNFDSVFNRSRHTWSWGSPDILPMFKEGAVPGRIDADTYAEEAEDFTKDATYLDIWVFDKVKAMFAEARTNATLNEMLRQDKVVFFLHLLGLDTTGHFFRPYSKEYLHNIKVVDQGVAEITQLIEEFYQDEGTAFVFTADHGMHDLGSHGDGHPDNTRTPLIAWGAGVAKPNITTTGVAPGHNKYSSDWNLDHVQRHDVDQADVAALMAYLAGLEFPVNSEGVLPLSYLDATPEQKSHAALVNTKEVLEMYAVKEAAKRNTELRFRPYSAFADRGQTPSDRVRVIEKAIADGNFEHSIELSHDLFKTTLQALRYLQTYDWLFLRVLITLGYLGWMAFAATTVIDMHILHGSGSTDRTVLSISVFSSILVLLYSSFVISKSPVTYYAHAFFPVFFWEEVYARRQSLQAGLQVFFSGVNGKTSRTMFAIQAVLYIIVLEALVQSYFHRIIFTVLYILGAFWPFAYGKEFVTKNALIVVPWMFCCLVLSTFTMLTVLKTESSAQITFGGLLMLGTGVFYLLFQDRILNRPQAQRSSSWTLSRVITGVQAGVLALTIIVTRSSIDSMQARQGLPLGNQVVGWVCLVSSLVLPFVHRVAPDSHYLHRLMVIFLTFSPGFVILTISYEGLFYMVFCSMLLLWVQLEHAVYLQFTPPTVISSTTTVTADGVKKETHRALCPTDLRITLFLLVLLQSAFFSTGNIASVSSFSLEAVARLIPIFDPFSQGALLILKLMMPFGCISAALGILNRRIGLQSSALFMVVMAIGDVMTLNFFWMVRDEGSWLDIGTTISHFVIGSVLSIFCAGLEGVSELLISGVEVEDALATKAKEAGRAANGHVAANGGASKGVGVGGAHGQKRRPARQIID